MYHDKIVETRLNLKIPKERWRDKTKNDKLYNTIYEPTRVDLGNQNSSIFMHNSYKTQFRSSGEELSYLFDYGTKFAMQSRVHLLNFHF